MDEWPISDVLIGLQHGDEGKGKVTKCLIETKKKYNYCVRFNGGPNAGHTIYHNDKKYVTHQIPTGIFYNIKCLIGTGCVIDINKLKKEIDELTKSGIDVKKYLKISKYAHIINNDHIDEDIKNNPIGSTGSGIRPVYRDKYDRKGTRVIDISCNKTQTLLGCDIVDPYDELNTEFTIILFEGAQGFELDIDSSNYPYVTSSHCLVGHINTCGVSVKTIRNIIGVMKLYDTYVGKKNFQSDDPDIKDLGILGSEIGATTGRNRQCNWLNLDNILKAIKINGVNKLIVNKCDIIKTLGKYKLYHVNLKTFQYYEEMIVYIESIIKKYFPNIIIKFSSSKTSI